MIITTTTTTTTITIITIDHAAPHGMSERMHDCEQQQMSLIQRSLVTQLEQSIDQAEALQSLELQRLRLLIERRQTQRQPRIAPSLFHTIPDRTGGGDFVIPLRRAA